MQDKQFFRKPYLSTMQSDISFDVLCEYVHGIKYTGLGLLIALSKITNTKYEEKEKEMVFLPATMAMMAVIATKELDGDIDKIEDIPDEKIRQILQMSARTDGYPISVILIPRDKISILCKVVGLQVALQGDLLCRIVRYACIIGLAGTEFTGLEELSEDKLGEISNHNLLHVYTFLFWLFSTIFRGITFTKDDLKSSSANIPILRNSIEELLQTLSNTKDDVIQHIEASKRKRLLGFSIPFDLFCRKPLIKLPDERYLRMPEVFSRSTASQYLFFARRQSLLKDGTRQAALALNRLGERFEKYVYHLLSACLPGFDAYPEIKIQISKGEYRTPDGIYSNGIGKDVIIMQAKLKPPTSGLLLGELGISYRANDLRSTYSEMLCQSIKFLLKIKNLMEQDLLKGEALEIAERVLCAKTIRLVSFSSTIPPIFHWGPGKDILWEIAARKLSDQSPNALAWFSELKKSGLIHDCFLLSDPEPFELFSIKNSETDITEDIDLWWDGIQNPTEDYLGLPIDLREYINNKYGNDENILSCFMLKCYERLSDRIKNVLKE